MTQYNEVLYYMKRKGGITSLEAFKKLGVSRLSAVIYKLKERGIDVKDVWVEVPNRYGDYVRVKKYFVSGQKSRKSLFDLIDFIRF